MKLLRLMFLFIYMFMMQDVFKYAIAHANTLDEIRYEVQDIKSKINLYKDTANTVNRNIEAIKDPKRRETMIHGYIHKELYERGYNTMPCDIIRNIDDITYQIKDILPTNTTDNKYINNTSIGTYQNNGNYNTDMYLFSK